MAQVEVVASLVRTQFPFAFCHACIAAKLHADEREVQRAARLVALLPGFAVNRRICSSCGRMDDVLESTSL